MHSISGSARCARTGPLQKRWPWRSRAESTTIVPGASPLRPLPSRLRHSVLPRLLKPIYVHVRSYSEKLPAVDGPGAVDRVTEPIEARRLAFTEMRPRPGERLEGVNHKTQGPSCGLIPVDENRLPPGEAGARELLAVDHGAPMLGIGRQDIHENLIVKLPAVPQQPPHLDLDEPVLAASLDGEIALLATLRGIRDGEFDPGIPGGSGCTHLIQYQPHRLRLGVGANAGLKDLLGPLVDGLRLVGVSCLQPVSEVSNEGSKETGWRGHATNL